MAHVKFYYGDSVPLEMHKARIVQKLNLLPIEQRWEAMTGAGNNTFLLKNRDVFMDMLTDSGVNAMSDKQQAAMMEADDSYAGSETLASWRIKFGRFSAKSIFCPHIRAEHVSMFFPRSLSNRAPCTDELSFYDHQSAHCFKWGDCGRTLSG